jgi:hypothetical protein
MVGNVKCEKTVEEAKKGSKKEKKLRDAEA